ncbi:unnamed protein product [Microthlaspi erraticum]|uniref:Phorbol-ester/DAG-type domain-containing protein n=1 Tax=Microthlaspi erraticum TaxID=1685480 RepID=A0A6D2JFG4_9BRAS|nr:unnamed protein product [Microthlaspi erraticum]
MEEVEVRHQDLESKQTSMEIVRVPQLHKHPLIPFTRFEYGRCEGCRSRHDDHHAVGSHKKIYIYGGYCCNELGCDKVLFHTECAKPLQETNHSSHPDHPLKLVIQDSQQSTCFKVGYSCTICDFKLDLECARRQEPLVLPANSHGHEHPLELVREPSLGTKWKTCKICLNKTVTSHYRCQQCDEFVIHMDCVCFSPEAYHTSHPQHPLKSLKCQVPDYADDKCLLCRTKFDNHHHQLHHCDVCNFSICRACMKDPPPVDLESLTTHQHQLHLFPRRMDFTCNACGTLGDRSPYLCHQCNFMIHRESIGLPRVININRHDHRISYTPRLGHGEWKCKVCRKKVDGFYGAYSCFKCHAFSVHSKCATRKDVWDMVEREGTSEEEEIIAPYEVIDDNTIKHFSHDHNLQLNKDENHEMMILPESTLCVACVSHIFSEPFFSCKQCGFIIHEKCANLPRRKRHMRNNKPFTVRTDSHREVSWCKLCHQYFTGFRYESGPYLTLDVRCASATDTLVHESHPHPLHYYSRYSHDKPCSRCGSKYGLYKCDECDYILDGKCALLPEKVMRNRYDDHPLFLSYGGERRSVDGEYWCEACETKVDPERGFYTCNDCGVFLHVSCVVGVFSYIIPGSSVSCCAVRVRDVTHIELRPVETRSNEEVVSNTSLCRPLCFVCNSRYKLPLLFLRFSRMELMYTFVL